MNKKILSLVFFISAVLFGGYLYYSINFLIDDAERIEKAEGRVIESLKIIRDVENAYAMVKGKYTDSWDSLVNFVKDDNFYLTQRKEKIFELSYGTDSVQITIDTLGMVGVEDSLFSQASGRMFDPNEFGYVPGVEQKVRFKIWTGVITRGGVGVNVIEVYNPSPVNPKRREDNEYNTRKPLRFGSRTSVSTSGNWE